MKTIEKNGCALGQRALAFYRGGKKIRGYDISQLIPEGPAPLPVRPS